MSAESLDKFLKALEVVKKDYTCGVCSELCKNPISLSTCFHIVCSEHFDDLKTCPTCKVSLKGCTAFSDDRLGTCIESTKELDKILYAFKNKDSTMKKSGMNTVNKTSENIIKSATKTQVECPAVIEKTNQSKPASVSNANVSLSTTASKNNIGIEKRNKKGETLLHIACRLGKVDQIADFLKQGANTNTKDNAGWTPLHEVVQNGRLDLVKLLLQYSTLIDVPGQSNETPLHEAVRYKHSDIAEELVKNGADINARNCKGETPLQLASPDMKRRLLNAADNVIQTQSFNISHVSALYYELDCEDIRVYCVSQFRTVHSKLKALMKHHSNLHIELKLTKKVTHLIIDTDDGVCQSTTDVLQAVVSTLWILSSQWVTKSSEDKLEPFTAYEVQGIGTKSNQGAKNSRYNKYKQLPGIFDGCHFYFHNFTAKYEISKTLVVTKAVLSKLVTDAGGIVLRRAPNPELIPEQECLVPYHASKKGKLVNCSHYIIYKDVYEPMYNMQHLKALPIGWLIECLEKYELCEPW